MYARPLLCPELIGRDDEVGVIKGALEQARGGRGAALVLVGEAGVGKSRLAQEASRAAAQCHMRTLRGRCVQGGRNTPYRPLTEALLSALRGQSPPDVPELRPFKPILARLIPDWTSEASAATDPSIVLLGEAILRLLLVLAGDGGCLLVLEDLHWADPETLALLDYLCANLTAHPLVLLGTLRTGERSQAQVLVNALAASRTVQLLGLERLDENETFAMAEACLGSSAMPEPMKAALAASAEGLPLLIEDLLAAWMAAGQLTVASSECQVHQELEQLVPASFADTVRRRLAAMGQDATAVLQLAAALGRSFDWRVLPAAAGLNAEEVLACLQEAVGHQLVSVSSAHGAHAFEFRHALTQAAVLTDVLPPQRARLAATLLHVIEREHPGWPGDWCELGARLAEEAAEPEQAAALLLESGRRALARGALTTAEATLRQAQRMGSTGSLELEIDEALVDALAMAGKHEQVQSVGLELLRRLEAQASPARRLARMRLQMARALVAASDWSLATQHLAAARDLAGACQPPVDPAIDALAAHVAIGQGRLADAKELAERALAGAELAGMWEVACEALEVLGRLARERNLQQAAGVFDQACHIAEEHGLAIWRLRAMHELGTIDIFTPGAGPRRLQEARDLAEQTGALGVAAIIDVQLSAIHMALGEFDAVLDLASRSADMAQWLGLSSTRAVALLFAAEAYGRQGPNRPAMEQALREALEAAGNDELLRAEVEGAAWGDCRAFASLVEEDRERALREAQTAQEFFRRTRGAAPSPSRGLWALLETLAGPDGPEACREVAESPVMIQPPNRAYLHYAEAIRLGRTGQAPAAAQSVLAGDELLAVSWPWFQHLAHRLLADDALAHGWGTPLLWLAEAAAFFARYGRQPVASACRSLQRKGGAPGKRGPRAHPTVPPALRARGVTDREMEVLSIIGQGLSNRDIGRRLYLSTKTVEKHISSLMDKLDVRTRAQLAVIAASGALPN